MQPPNAPSGPAPAQEPAYNRLAAQDEEEPEYEWQAERSIPTGLDAADETVVFGYDIMLPEYEVPALDADGEPVGEETMTTHRAVIPEFHINGEFDTKGGTSTLPYDVGALRGMATGGDFTDWVRRYTRKDTVHEALPGYTPERITDIEELEDDALYVEKPADGLRGEGIEFRKGHEFDRLPSNRVVERYEGGTTEVFGRDYACCARGILKLDIGDGTITMHGGDSYGRTAARPMDDMLATRKQRHAANLAQGGMAVSLDAEQRLVAREAMVDATERLFRRWAGEQRLGAMFGSAQDYGTSDNVASGDGKGLPAPATPDAPGPTGSNTYEPAAATGQ